ncbi:hypothetical protein GF367_01250 [Candidatus Woesearchaeota archaeon]|nr:hypothetical protein [Candidatus Woesearchaeota archaeon]
MADAPTKRKHHPHCNKPRAPFLKTTSLIWTYALLMIALTTPLTAMSVGVSPLRIERQEALPGSTLHEELLISVRPPGEVAIISIRPPQGALKAWMHNHSVTYTFEDTTSRKHLPITITIPTQAPPGNYTDTLIVSVTPKLPGTTEAQASIPIRLHFSVVEEQPSSPVTEQPSFSLLRALLAAFWVR